MGQTVASAPEHYRPSDIEWELFHDPHGRPTTPVRMLKTDGPSFLETKFEPNFSIGHHWHPYDTLYFIMEGDMTIGPEGRFAPGDVRWIKAGHAYGPELSGDDGVRFFLMSMGDEIGLNWADLYDTPDDLSQRLETLPARWGRKGIDEAPKTEIAPGCCVQTLCDENPYILHLSLEAGAELPDYRHPVDALCLVRQGSLDLSGEPGLATEDVRWVPAGSETRGAKAGGDGAGIYIIGMGGLPALAWV